MVQRSTSVCLTHARVEQLVTTAWLVISVNVQRARLETLVKMGAVPGCADKQQSLTTVTVPTAIHSTIAAQITRISAESESSIEAYEGVVFGGCDVDLLN